MTKPTITLHGLKLSGHSHRVELMLNMLGLPYHFIQTTAESRATPDFRALNPLGQIPVLEDGDLVVTDSNAILTYLAKRYAPDSHWLPQAAEAAAQVQRWLSIAAGELRFGPATVRILWLFRSPNDRAPAIAIANRLLPFVEQHLATRKFLAAEHATIADLACYSYTKVAPESGDLSLEPYPALRAWHARVEALPHFVPMPVSREPLPA